MGYAAACVPLEFHSAAARIVVAFDTGVVLAGSVGIIGSGAVIIALVLGRPFLLHCRIRHHALVRSPCCVPHPGSCRLLASAC